MVKKGSSDQQNTWNRTPKTDATRLTENMGLDCVTVDLRDSQPYFFLFCDLDTKELDTLRVVLQKCARIGISAYFWETSKGWHVVSPALLKCRIWTSLRIGLQDIQRYYFDTIRWSTRLTDGAELFFQDSTKGKFQESLTLHEAIARKFATDPILRGIQTKLTWSKYDQLVFKQVFLKLHCYD